MQIHAKLPKVFKQISVIFSQLFKPVHSSISSQVVSLSLKTIFCCFYMSFNHHYGNID